MTNSIEILKDIRKRSLILANKAHDGNLQSVFSSLEIIWWLYDCVLDLNGIKEGKPERTYFFCSKGQATLGLLLILSRKGLIDDSELESYGEFDSRISMQVDRIKFERGVEMSAGSLGHGLPIGAGVALAKRIKGVSGNVFVLVGDGELHEGTNWEAIQFIGSRRLTNVCLIVDNNESHVYMHEPNGIMSRINSFGFDVETCNGHDVDDLSLCYRKLENSYCPKAIIANTRRGYGSKTLMTDKSWFHKAPSDDELQGLLTEVESFDPIESLSYVLV